MTRGPETECHAADRQRKMPFFSFVVETGRRMAHSGIMPEIEPYSVRVREDAHRPGRYRWDVFETERLRDTSTFSFATRREAQTDADKFIVKLLATWRNIN